MSNTVTARAHTNIALIKYWGKADTQLNLPTTSSLSLTLDKFYTSTSVKFDRNLPTDSLTLNGEQVDASRVQGFLNLLRAKHGQFDPVAIDSQNHVPTAAGLASSASSFAALTAAMFGLLELPEDLQEMSRVARRGSGSATRSIYGNLALWHKGHDNQSSFAESFYDEDIGLSMIVAEISSQQKKISSSLGMQLAQSAPTYQAWVEESAKQLIAMQAAIKAKDIEQIGRLAQANALAMHEQNRRCSQPFDYFTEQTRAVIQFAQQCYKSGILALVTIDAGPNVKIITDRASEQKLLELCRLAFPELAFELVHAGGGIQYV